jgi:hypothetical protein
MTPMDPGPEPAGAQVRSPAPPGWAPAARGAGGGRGGTRIMPNAGVVHHDRFGAGLGRHRYGAAQTMA